MTDQPTTEEVLQGTPDPEFIKQQVEAQAKVTFAASVLGSVTNQLQGILALLTNNNPRLSLAVANELSLIYSEALRRSLVVNQAPPAVSSPEDATEAPQAPIEQPIA